jgi:hypothetical protein
MNIKLLDAVKRIVDKSSIGKLPQDYSGEITLRIIIHQGGVRGKKETIENTISD